MTVLTTRARDRPAVDGVLGRVLDALLREDYRGLRSAGRVRSGPDGEWLESGGLSFPVRPGIDNDWVVRRPALAQADGTPVEGLAPVLAALRPAADDLEAAAGFARFEDECWQAVAVAGMGGPAEVATLPLGRGLAGSLAYERLAAYLDHPVYPTGRARLGLTAAGVRRYAPEFGRTFRPRWLALPAARVEQHGDLPDWWPTRRGRHLLPVHPLTIGRLSAVLAETGLESRAELLPARTTDPETVPTLSMRTVALAADPSVHLKLPLPAATLGARNRRSLVPGTLADGARTHQLLAAILAREPAYADRILLADETCHAHAGHEYLGYLVRRYPPGLEHATVVPVAALPLVAGHVGLDLAGYLELLIGWHVTLWLRYGVALEAHQQNIGVILTPGRPPRLLYKDNDGPRLDQDRLVAALGADAPRRSDFADQRLWARDPSELAAMFTTIALHLAAGSVILALAARGTLDANAGLAMLRETLAGALAEHADQPHAGTLRDQVLDAERWPVKTMVTAGTLLPKHRTGAGDINKHYGTTGPNYLRAPRPVDQGEP